MSRNGNEFALSLLAVAGLTASVAADLTPGALVVAPSNGTTATVTFLGSDAGYTGHLYFLGWGNGTGITNPVADTGTAGLGQWLFSNHSSTPGSTAALDGVFNAGDVLYFAYDITAPNAADDLFRADTADDAEHFAYDDATGRLFIEDLRPWFSNYDGDYNDAMFTVSFASVPAPGAAMLLATGGLCAARRPRRRD